MNKCLFCGAELKSVEGKKERQFCNGNCRNKHYYKIKTSGQIKKKTGRPKVTHLLTPGSSITQFQTKEKYINNTRDIQDVTEVVGQMNEISKKIAEYEEEMKTIPDVGLGAKRRKFLQSKILAIKKLL
jgi:hypothetical protein